MIPHPVMMGFVNGLAIVIFTSQLGMFKSQGEWLSGMPLYTMLGLVFLTMGIMYFLPKITKNTRCTERHISGIPDCYFWRCKHRNG